MAPDQPASGPWVEVRPHDDGGTTMHVVDGDRAVGAGGRGIGAGGRGIGAGGRGIGAGGRGIGAGGRGSGAGRRRSAAPERLVGRGPLLRRVERELGAGRPVTLEGVAGVGKTRVLEALARRHDGPVLRVAPDAPASPETDVRPPEGGHDLLVLVDDAPLLDTGTVDRLRGVDEASWCRIVTTSRSGDGSGTERWWATDGWQQLEVAPLDRIATAERLRDVLGGLVAPDLAHAVWRATGGHPVGILELARDAQETGCIAMDAEAWRLLAPLPVRRLTELVGDRFTSLDGPARLAADVLALGSPLPIHLASSLLEPAGVRELERRGLARFEQDGAGRSVTLVDGMHAEVLIAAMSADRRRVLLSRLADAYDRSSGPDRTLLRRSRWRLELGGWDAGEFEAASCLASTTNDADLAERLALRAVELGGGTRSQLVLGIALTGRGDVDSAGPVLRAADTAAADPQERAWSAMAGAHRHAIGAGRWEEGVTHLADRVDGIPEGVHRTELVAYAAVLHAMRGTPETADRCLAVVEDGAGPSPRGELLATVGSALTGTGRLDPDRVAAAVATLRDDPDLESWLPLAGDLLVGLELLTDRERTPHQRSADARPHVEAALRDRDAASGWWLAVTGWLHLETGDLAQAHDRLVEALLTTEELDPLRLRPRLAADLALIAATTGSPAEAEGRLDQVGADRRTAPQVAARCATAQALIDAQLLGVEVGADTAVEAGDLAARVGLSREAIDAWHLAVRLGRPGEVRARVTVADLPVDHPDVVLLRRHAEHLDAGDAAGLLEVARDLAADGRYLVAAEAAAQAAALGAARPAAALAAGLATACPEARTPALEGVTRVELSPRRREVGRFAIQGVDGRRIAARLGVSVRTVENHLAHVYREVGVRNRRELGRLYRADRGPFAAGASEA